MITIVNNGAIADTQAEAEAYVGYPNPCIILCKDTLVNLLFEDDVLAPYNTPFIVTKTAAEDAATASDLALKQDALPSITGKSLKFLRVKNDETGYEYASVGSGGYDGDPNTINQDSTHRFVTDTQIDTWDAASITSFLAAADISAYKVVTSIGVQANSATSAHRGKVIGITTASVLTGFIGTVKGFGTISNPAWSWTIGDKIYLNGTDLSTTAPSSGFSMYIGTSTASDTIDVQLGVPILL